MSLGAVLRRFYYSNLTCHPLGHVMVSDCHQITHHAVEAGTKKRRKSNLIVDLLWWNVSKQKIALVLC